MMLLTHANLGGGVAPPTEDGDLGKRNMPSPLDMAMSDYDTSTTTSGDITRFEAFEYQDLADLAVTVKTTFDDLTGVSPLWFSVEKDQDAEAGSHSLSSKCGGGGYEMFGDWRVEESLVDVFEDLPQAGSDKQEILRVVNSLLATYDENVVKQRQGLEECVRAFETVIEGDLNAQLDTQAEQCTQRWNEEKEKTEVAQAGLTELEAHTVARLEGLGQVLKDRQSTVLDMLKHEREANTRKILASALSDPLEEGRLLFERQVEETQLEGKLKQRRRLLDLSSEGVQVQQTEIEAALLKAARDQVENLMQVVDKMQNQQTMLLASLQAEKKKVAAMRQHVSSRLGASSQKRTRATIQAAERGNFPSRGEKRITARKGKVTALAVNAAVAIGKRTEAIAGVDKDSEGVKGEDNDSGLGEERDELSGVDLLESCDRLENDNLGLRQRLAKLELRMMQKEHGEDEEELHDDSQLAPVLEAKKELQGQLEGLQMANEERSKELERIKTLTQKVKTLRRRLVFKLACKVMRRRFQEAGLGAGNDPSPPPGPIATDVQAGAADGLGLPQEMQLHAALLQQKLAIQREIERATREEDKLQRVIEEAKGINSSGATTGCIDTDGGDCASTGQDGGDDVGDMKGRQGRSRDGSGDCQSGLGDENNDEGAGGAPTPRKSSGTTGGGGEGVPGKSSVQTRSAYASTSLRKLARMKTKVQRRLAALRAVAEKNEEAAQANTMDDVDNEAVEAVLRNEEIAREKALGVLDILCSRAMAKARARWLKEALERSVGVQTKTVAKHTPPATPVAPATSAPMAVDVATSAAGNDTPVAPTTSAPMAADVATSAAGNEPGTQISDGATPTAKEKKNDEQDTQQKSALSTGPASGMAEDVRKYEPPENAPPTVKTEVVVQTATQEAQAGAEAEPTAVAHDMPTVETASVAVVAQGVSATAEAKASVMAPGTPQDGAKAREREECEKLVNMRAEKIRLIKGN
eukprot:g8403.t1